MTCAHQPKDTVGPVAARYCRHCGAEIVPAACAECHGGTFVTDDSGREIDCPDCNGTGCEGWRKA